MATLPSQVFWNLANVDKNTLTFQLRPTLVAYANTLRRMVLTGVESVAFRADMNDKGATTDVVVTTNTTPMTNEMLADRIGLVPVHVDDPLTWNPNEYTFHLSVTNETADTKPVLASDFEVRMKGRPEDDPVLVPNTQFFRPDPISKDTCLIAVLKGKQMNQNPQKIEITAKATTGTGREHIRFSPVSQCSYAYTLDTDEGRQREMFEKWLMNNKKVEPSSLESDEKRRSALEREFQTMEIQRCFLTNEKGEPFSFDFVVETIGIQPVSRIVERALQNIETRCVQYANLSTGNLPETIKIQPAEARMKGFDFIFQKEDHTLGNLLQSWMEDNLMDTKEITFAGYKVPHPLRDEMLLRVGVEDGQETTARAMVGKAAAACAEMFRQWRHDWLRATGAPIGSRSRDTLRLTAANAKALVSAASAAGLPAAPTSMAPRTVTSAAPRRSALKKPVSVAAKQ
jgi:DNA-directed RNA polymerase subunit L/DNA-directed RNA polymerase alpha subunit